MNLYIIYTLKRENKDCVGSSVYVCVCVVYRCSGGQGAGVHVRIPSKQRTKCAKTPKWRKANGARA